MNNLVLPLGRVCASNALMRSITIDASVNDSSWEALDFENKSLGIIDDELTQLLRKWGLEDAVEALAKHGWNSVSRLKIFKRDEHMDELGLPSGTVCALEILLQSLVTNTLSAPPAALPVAAVTTALQTVSPAAESAAALATPAVVPTAASAASLQTVAPRSTTAAIQAVAPQATTAAAAVTTTDLRKVGPSAAPAALVATPTVISNQRPRFRQLLPDQQQQPFGQSLTQQKKQQQQ